MGIVLLVAGAVVRRRSGGGTRLLVVGGTLAAVAIGIPVTNLGALKCGLARPFIGWTREAVQAAGLAFGDSAAG